MSDAMTDAARQTKRALEQIRKNNEAQQPQREHQENTKCTHGKWYLDSTDGKVRCDETCPKEVYLDSMLCPWEPRPHTPAPDVARIEVDAKANVVVFGEHSMKEHDATIARTAKLAAIEELKKEFTWMRPMCFGRHEAICDTRCSWVVRKRCAESLRTQSTTASAYCIWTEDDDGVWDTECGNKFELISGEAPLRQRIKFCPYCGKAIRQSTTAGDEQE
jgi:hypothetical protein